MNVFVVVKSCSFTTEGVCMLVCTLILLLGILSLSEKK